MGIWSSRQCPSSCWHYMTSSQRVRRCWRRLVSTPLLPHSWHASRNCPWPPFSTACSCLPAGSNMVCMTLLRFPLGWRHTCLTRTCSQSNKFHSSGQVGRRGEGKECKVGKGLWWNQRMVSVLQLVLLSIIVPLQPTHTHLRKPWWSVEGDQADDWETQRFRISHHKDSQSVCTCKDYCSMTKSIWK